MKMINIFFMTLFLFITYPAIANDEAFARAQYMIRQMNAELTQLKSTNQTLLAEKTSQEKELAALQKKYDKLADKADENKKAMKGRVVEIKQQYKDEVEAHVETRRLLAEKIQEKNDLLKIATGQTQTIDLCVANNKKLYEIDQELLTVYENKGVWDSVTQAEPFSRLSQVKIENLVDDYQYRLDDLRVEVEL